jgi:general secretion pathway protein B
MSYVLEALKRADAQRERGQVPGLNAQPADLPPLDDNVPAARHAPGLLLAAAGVLLVVLLGGWWWSRPAPVVVTAASAPAPAPTTAPAPAQSQVVAPPAPAQAPAPEVEPLRVTPKPPPAPPTPAVAAAPKAEATASAPGRITPLRELPEATRRELPQLVIGGSMYSSQPSQRLVILNGQVFHEGGQVGADLVVEQIRPKSVVMRFKQQRYEMPL